MGGQQQRKWSARTLGTLTAATPNDSRSRFTAAAAGEWRSWAETQLCIISSPRSRESSPKMRQPLVQPGGAPCIAARSSSAQGWITVFSAERT